MIFVAVAMLMIIIAVEITALLIIKVALEGALAGLVWP